MNQSKIDRLGRLRRRILPWPTSSGTTWPAAWVWPPEFKSVRGRELYADCMAGVFTRYGYSYSGRLDASDYWEGYNALGDIYPNEGSPPVATR